MRKRMSVLSLFCFAMIVVSGESRVRAAVTQPQTDSIPATTQTDWGPQTKSLQGQNPLVFNQFNTTQGTLQSIDITMSYTATELASMTFTTPSTITLKTSLPSSPDTGTKITLNGPSDTAASNLLTAALPVLTYTKTYGGSPGQALPQQFSTTNAPGSPFFLTPDGQSANTPQTGTVTVHLTSAAQLALFTGSGTIALPAHASAGSTFISNTGNGSGMIETFAGITVSLQYNYVPSVPEPSSVALLGMGGGGLLLVGRRARRRASSL